MGDPLVKNIPDTGWIAEYMKWTEESEPPARFRFATAMGLISAAVNRKVWLPYENRGTYPNLWILLMGPPGCGKDSAINQGYDLFMHMENRPKVIAEKITPEALIKTLAQNRAQEGATSTKMNRDCKGVVFAPELATFLGKSRYNEGMMSLLTRLYDCPSILPTETIIRHNITLVDVCLSMLWGSTPDWYTRYMPEGAMCGGFMSRVTYFFYLQREKRIPNPKPFDLEHQNRLVTVLDQIGALQGPMEIVDDAKEMYDKWYCALPDPADNGGEEVDGYISRKPMTVKKIAMILSISESDNKKIKLDHMDKAIKIMEILERHLYIEVPKLASTGHALATDEVLRVLKLKPEMSRREAMQRSYRKLEGKREEFDKIIDWLLHMESIKQFRKDGATAIWYKALRR